MAALDPLNINGPSVMPPPLGAAPPMLPSLGGLPPLTGAPSTPSSQLPADTSLKPLVQSQSQLRQQQIQDKLNELQNPAKPQGFWQNLRHGLAVAGNIAGDVVDPGAMALIPGTELHKQVQIGSLRREQAGLQQQDAAAQDDLAKRQLEMAETNEHNEKAGDEQPLELTPEAAAAIGHPELAGTSISQKAFTALSSNLNNNKTRTETNATTNATKGEIAAGKNNVTLQVAGMHVRASQEIADAHNKTQTLIAQMRDATSRANTSDHIAAGEGKVPAMITNRASLANNVTENADAVEQLLNQHPDIVGAAGGRYSNVQQMIGSNDPNIQALGVRMHNIALASNGAHGIRSAQAVKETEDELFNHFHAGPNAILGALDATRDSMKTFIQDEANFRTTGARTGNNRPSTSASPAAAPAQTGTSVLKFNPQTGRLE